MVASPSYAGIYDPPLPTWRVYIIDFGESRRLQHGPHRQEPIQLPDSQYEKPAGVTSMVPYSWDVYCVGELCEGWFVVRLYDTRILDSD